MSEKFWCRRCKQSNYHCGADHFSPTHLPDHRADRNLNCADWMISAPEWSLLICYDDPSVQARGEGGGVGSRSIYFVSHAKGQLGSVQATGRSTTGPLDTRLGSSGHNNYQPTLPALLPAVRGGLSGSHYQFMAEPIMRSQILSCYLSFYRLLTT